ncbi:MAG TPA: NAD(P)/FAD-dependent oxidoreductase [Bacteroidales bacterium]|nr:NAD(P)/FAD-dependent oxidoreductase [Bacteroidales bacterium]HRZ50132.1 NAD(P)/FAD-dependent oxidoreductase [Bacteroidales bacterium]
MKYDVIVIGGGLGGLTAGAKLAKEGKKVLLIEQHDRPGGCATTFKRHDFTFEVGLHEMDGLDARDMKTRIFRDLGVFDRVEFLRVPEFYRFVNSRYQVTIPHDPAMAAAVLTEIFPDEESGIAAYFDQVLNARKNAQESAAQPERSVGEFMDEIIQNNDLKLILLGNLGYFHDDPYSLSLNYYAAAQGSYYQGGGNFIKGGSQVLSDFLADQIRSHGGEVLLNHLVTGIKVVNGNAAGVYCKAVRGKDSNKMYAEADEVISNAALPGVLDGLLPPDAARPLEKQFEGLVPGASLLTLYLGFSKPLRDCGSHFYSTFLYDDSVKNLAGIRQNNHSDFSTRSFTFVDYSQIDSGLAPEGKSVGAVCCIDYLSDWEGLAPEAYKARKSKVAEDLIARLETLIPGIREYIAYSEVGTAKTVARYTMNPEGAVYGFAQTPFRVRQEAPVLLPNLHVASAWSKTGGGFSGAIFSGYLCAMGVLRKQSVR